MRHLITTTHLFLLSLLLFSCGEPELPEVPPFEDQDISVDEKMKIAVSEAYIHQIGLPDSSYTFLKAYYDLRNYKPRWINDSLITEEGQRIKDLLVKVYQIGIPEGSIAMCETQNYIQDELNITISLAQIGYALEHGFVDYENKTKKKPGTVDPNLFDELMTFSDTVDYREQFIKFGPDDSTYRVLAHGLIDFVDHHYLDTTTFQVRSLKFDSTMAIEKARVALVSKHYLKEDVRDSVGIAEGLTHFQEDNELKPDGVVGKFTSLSLNESTYHKMERILLAMDKIRAQEKRPEKYILINIPEYKLRFFADDTLRSDHNIVVGKIENQTPELTSRLKKIVVYPYWNVPYSISSKEILPAVKNNTGYLVKNNYRVYKNGEEVDPYTVNWRSIRQNAFPYKVVQDPGPKNALGVLKFDFYNEHSVYFHDTPAKALFGVDVRAYSHGCMRTQNPIDLAKTILHFDSINKWNYNEMRPDSLDTLLARGENYEIMLKTKIPIFVEYLSVTRKNKDQMAMYLDIYGRDEEYLKIMRGE